MTVGCSKLPKFDPPLFFPIDTCPWLFQFLLATLLPAGKGTKEKAKTMRSQFTPC